MLVDRLNTRVMLRRRNCNIQTGVHCVLCQSGIDEDVDHLLFGCPFARRCWLKLQIQWSDRLGAERPHNQSIFPPRALAQIQLGVVVLQVILSIFQAPAHTGITQPSRSKWKHKVKLEKLIVRQTTMETQEFVSRSSDSPTWIIRLHWGARWMWVFFNSIPLS